MVGLHRDLAIVDEFWRLAHATAQVEGFLDPREGYLLYRAAAEGPGIGAIVEIGSYCGRSTAFLAAGAKAAQRERVFAVDHFQGSTEHQAGQPFASAVLAQEGTTLGRFRANLHRLDLIDHVEPIVAMSAEAAGSWRGPIRLLFIDGDHAYESVRADFFHWTPFLVAGGLVALHDVGHTPSVTRFFEEVQVNRDFSLVAAAVSLRFFQRM